MEFIDKITGLISVVAYILIMVVSLWGGLWTALYAFSGASLQFAWAKKTNGFMGVILLAVCWVFAWPFMGVWAIAWRYRERSNFESKGLINRMVGRYTKGDDPRY